MENEQRAAEQAAQHAEHALLQQKADDVTAELEALRVLLAARTDEVKECKSGPAGHVEDITIFTQFINYHY